ncbi:MAG: hypothetical protein AAF661_07225 [Pseudomonadota bacterium]
MLRLMFIACSALAVSTLVASSNDLSAMTYPEFEKVIPDHQTATCPEAVSGPSVFCAVAVGPVSVRLFVFRWDGKQPLVAFANYGLDRIEDVKPPAQTR